MSYGQALLLMAGLMFAAYVAGMLAGIALFAWLEAAAAREQRKDAPAWPRRPR